MKDLEFLDRYKAITLLADQRKELLVTLKNVQKLLANNPRTFDFQESMEEEISRVIDKAEGDKKS